MKASLNHLIEEYHYWKKQEKSVKENLDTVKRLITEHIEEHGDVDAKGSAQIEYDGNFYRKEKRVTLSLNHDNLEEILVQLGVYENFTKTILDEQKVEEGFKKGIIPEKYLDQIVNRKEVFAFTVRKKVDAPEEAESPV